MAETLIEKARKQAAQRQEAKADADAQHSAIQAIQSTDTSGRTLESFGFGLADSYVKPRIIAAVKGMDKQGKTHFGLSAPAPVAYFNFDIGLEGVVHKFINNGKKIYPMPMDVPTTQALAIAEWDRKFYPAYHHVIMHNKEVRSVVIDTETELWELLRMARFGQTTQVMPYMYGPVNAEFRAIIRLAYETPHPKNVIFLRKMKPVYIKNERTGDYEATGFGEMKYLVQVNLHAWRPVVVEDPPMDPNLNPSFHILVENCRQEPALMNRDFAGPDASFPIIASNILPGADFAAWL